MDNSQAEFDSFVGTSFTAASTPFKVPQGRGKRGKKASKPRVFKNPVCDICTFCGKEYRCHRSFINHKRQHVIKDTNSRYPNVLKITEHCLDCSFDTIGVLERYPAYGVMGNKYKELSANLKSRTNLPEWHAFMNIVLSAMTGKMGDKKILMPSALVNLLTKNCDALLSDIVKRKALSSALQSVIDCDPSVSECFVCDFALLHVKVILKFYSSCLKEVNNNPEDINVTFDTEDLETIHYCSGAVVHAFYRRGRSYPKNVWWKSVQKIILEQLLESDNVEGPPEIVKGWTKARSKGKLFFVSGKLFDFFVGITEILRKVTHKKFRIDYDRVLELTCGGVLVLLWDEAVSDSLSESASYELMCGMFRSFCNTYGVGKSKELINKCRPKKAEASLPLRSKVAPRQQT